MKLPPEVSECVRSCGGMPGIRSRFPPEEDIAELARAHAACGDEGRLSMLLALREGDLCVCVLKEITQMHDSRLSYHLTILKKAGLVTSRREGSYNIYGLTELGRSMLPS